MATAAGPGLFEHPLQKSVNASVRQLAQGERLAQLRQQGSPASHAHGLPPTLRAGIEALSGMDMGDVAVHRNSSKPAQLHAFAYAQGNAIHLGPGQERHLPHEAWHVVQQRQGRVRPTMQMKAGIDINDDAGLEREADVMGARALSAGKHMPFQAKAGMAAAPAPALARKVLQGNFAVQVVLEELDVDDPPRDGADAAVQTTHKETRIGSVHIADRPDGLFAPDEKSHTTAWAVYTDQLRNAVLGRRVADAVMAIHHLYTDAKNLPGVARAGHLSGKPLATYQAAKNAVDGLVDTDFSTVPEERQVEFVQRLGKAFLAYRNAIPLSQVDIGRATGHGEPAVLDELRPFNQLVQGWEANPDDEGGLRPQPGVAENARKAMWSLLDKGAITAFYELKTNPDTAPGTVDGGADGGAAQRIADVITQHLWTMENTYETAFGNIDMDSEGSIREYLRSCGFRGLYLELIYTKIVRHYDAATDKATQENNDRVKTAGAGNQGMFSVQVSLSEANVVTGLDIGGRAHTTLGSAQGSHATAWVVYVDGVRNAVLQKSFDTALVDLLRLCETASTLPGLKRVELLTVAQRPWFDKAADGLKDAMAAAKGGLTKLTAVPVLQRLVKAYLAFRNVVPLSEIKGGLADGNAEARNRAKIRYMESNFTSWTGIGAAPERDPQIYLEAFWELYDYKAVDKAALHEVEPEDAPGIHPTEDGMLMLGDSIRQHLVSMHDAYPRSYALLKADQKESIYYVLDKINVRGPEIVLARVHGKI